MSNKIFVKDLEIEAVIGIFDWEREVKQLIKISYEVEVDIKKAFKSDNIEDTFDYKTTSKKIIKFVEKSSFQLIEALAEKISKILDVSLNEFSELTKKNTDRLLSRDLNE